MLYISSKHISVNCNKLCCFDLSLTLVNYSWSVKKIWIHIWRNMIDVPTVTEHGLYGRTAYHYKTRCEKHFQAEISHTAHRFLGTASVAVTESMIQMCMP